MFYNINLLFSRHANNCTDSGTIYGSQWSNFDLIKCNDLNYSEKKVLNLHQYNMIVTKKKKNQYNMMALFLTRKLFKKWIHAIKSVLLMERMKDRGWGASQRSDIWPINCFYSLYNWEALFKQTWFPGHPFFPSSSNLIFSRAWAN